MGASPAVHGLATATTKYDQISLLGDFNFSNLFRRIDNNSPFRWALHGYAGIGFQAYSYERKINILPKKRIEILNKNLV